MNDSQEILDGSKKEKSGSSMYKTMNILSYIGNGVWGILFLLLFVACIVNGAAVASTVSLDSFFGGAIAFFAFLSALVVALCVVSIIGVLKMRKGKRKGFFLYAIANGLWALVLFYAASDNGGFNLIAGGVISFAFVYYYGMRLGKLS